MSEYRQPDFWEDGVREDLEKALRDRRESRIAPLLGISAVGEIVNLNGFTEYLERVLEDVED